MRRNLRVLIAADDRRERACLVSLLERCRDVTIVAQATCGGQAAELLARVEPELAFVAVVLPELHVLLDACRADARSGPLIVFLVSDPNRADQAVAPGAIDCLLEPVEMLHLRHALLHAHERLRDASGPSRFRQARMDAGSRSDTSHKYLRHIPVRDGDTIMLVAVADIASIVADRETLNLTTHSGEGHTITYRLKDLEARLDPAQFVRLSRGALVSVDAIRRITPLTAGTYCALLANGQTVAVSRMQARVLRRRLITL